MKGRKFYAPAIGTILAGILYYILKDGFGYVMDSVLTMLVQGGFTVLASLAIPDSKESFDEETASPGAAASPPGGVPPSSDA